MCAHEEEWLESFWKEIKIRGDKPLTYVSFPSSGMYNMYGCFITLLAFYLISGASNQNIVTNDTTINGRFFSRTS